MKKDAGGYKRKSRKLKITALLIVVIVILAAIFAVWYFNYRSWSVRELASKLAGTTGSPGFQPDLANKTVQISGTLTNYTEYMTTKGKLFVITLDNYYNLTLMRWGDMPYLIGDQVTIEVNFMWSQCNDDVRVYSPQVCLPGIGMLMNIESVSEAYNQAGGNCILAENATANQIRVNLTFISDPIELSNCNCSLTAGKHGGFTEYIDFLGYFEHGDSTRIDSIGNLSLSESGENGYLNFIDTNSNNLLDSGDYFLISGLKKPVTECGAYTYFLRVCRDSQDRFGFDLPDVQCYIVNYMEGPIRIIDLLPFAHLGSSWIAGETVKMTIDYVNKRAEWKNVTQIGFRNLDGLGKNMQVGNSWLTNGTANYQEFNVSLSALNFSLDLVCTIVDMQKNDLIDQGDFITIKALNGTKFWNASELMAFWHTTELSALGYYQIYIFYFDREWSDISNVKFLRD